eukprot:g9718.t1
MKMTSTHAPPHGRTQWWGTGRAQAAGVAATGGDGVSASVLQGTYVVGHLKGRGATCEVFEISNRGRKYAIKIGKKGSPTCADDSKMSITALTQHSRARDHVVHMFATFETPVAIYLILEYAHSDVSQYCREEFVKHGGVQLEAMGHLCRQMAAAVAYVHGCGVLHLDIKPGNFLVVYNKRERLEEAVCERLEDGGRPEADPILCAKIKLADFGMGAVLWEEGFAGEGGRKHAADASSSDSEDEWECSSTTSTLTSPARVERATRDPPPPLPRFGNKDAAFLQRDDIRTTHVRRNGNGGTERFMAPECFFQPNEKAHGALRLRASMDVWGLGMCVYVLLHNRTPWCHFFPLRRGYTICDPRMVIQFPFPQRFRGLLLGKGQGSGVDASGALGQLAGLNIVLRAMLQREQARRWTASQCLDQLQRMETDSWTAPTFFPGGAGAASEFKDIFDGGLDFSKWPTSSTAPEEASGERELCRATSPSSATVFSREEDDSDQCQEQSPSLYCVYRPDVPLHCYDLEKPHGHADDRCNEDGAPLGSGPPELREDDGCSFLPAVQLQRRVTGAGRYPGNCQMKATATEVHGRGRRKKRNGKGTKTKRAATSDGGPAADSGLQLDWPNQHNEPGKEMLRDTVAMTGAALCLSWPSASGADPHVAPCAGRVVEGVVGVVGTAGAGVDAASDAPANSCMDGEKDDPPEQPAGGAESAGAPVLFFSSPGSEVESVKAALRSGLLREWGRVPDAAKRDEDCVMQALASGVLSEDTVRDAGGWLANGFLPHDVALSASVVAKAIEAWVLTKWTDVPEQLRGNPAVTIEFTSLLSPHLGGAGGGGSSLEVSYGDWERQQLKYAEFSFFRDVREPAASDPDVIAKAIASHAIAPEEWWHHKNVDRMLEREKAHGNPRASGVGCLRGLTDPTAAEAPAQTLSHPYGQVRREDLETTLEKNKVGKATR